ncbi:hypothetical protein BH11BAC3_BH11BAC3_48070 [soil metagenome]
MITNKKNIETGSMILIILLINAAILEYAFTTNDSWYWMLLITLPLLIVTTIYNKKGRKLNTPGLRVIINTKYYEKKIVNRAEGSDKAKKYFSKMTSTN